MTGEILCADKRLFETADASALEDMTTVLENDIDEDCVVDPDTAAPASAFPGLSWWCREGPELGACKAELEEAIAASVEVTEVLDACNAELVKARAVSAEVTDVLVCEEKTSEDSVETGKVDFVRDSGFEGAFGS